MQNHTHESHFGFDIKSEVLVKTEDGRGWNHDRRCLPWCSQTKTDYTVLYVLEVAAPPPPLELRLNFANCQRKGAKGGHELAWFHYTVWYVNSLYIWCFWGFAFCAW